MPGFRIWPHGEYDIFFYLTLITSAWFVLIAPVACVSLPILLPGQAHIRTARCGNANPRIAQSSQSNSKGSDTVHGVQTNEYSPTIKRIPTLHQRVARSAIWAPLRPARSRRAEILTEILEAML